MNPTTCWDASPWPKTILSWHRHTPNRQRSRLQIKRPRSPRSRKYTSITKPVASKATSWISTTFYYKRIFSSVISRKYWRSTRINLTIYSWTSTRIRTIRNTSSSKNWQNNIKTSAWWEMTLQSIYSFRGARIENILSFRNDYPGYKLCKLEQNYRSTTTIVDVGRTVSSAGIRNRFLKKRSLKTKKETKSRVMKALSDKEEGFQVAQEIFRISQNEQADFNHFAILYRTNAQSRIMEESLRKRNIPYKVYGAFPSTNARRSKI